MRTRIAWSVGVFAVVSIWGIAAGDDSNKGAPGTGTGAEPSWSMNASVIEACSCPMFCQCYFNAIPAGHAGHGSHAPNAEAEHFCRFNNAYRVNRGEYGAVKLDGAKFWLYGDLGGDFSKGQMDWVVLTFDPSVTPQQREGLKVVVARLFPVKWNSFSIAPDAKIEWQADRDRATAKLDGGRVAEVQLKRFPGNTDDPVVIRNLPYWGAPRNDGFVMMPNEIQTLRKAPEGRQGYEFKGTNGFMITVDIGSGEKK